MKLIIAFGVAWIVGLLMFISIQLASRPSAQNAPSRLGTYNIYIPQSCAKRVMEFTHGKSRIEEMPAQDFVNLKHLIEGCCDTVNGKKVCGEVKMVQ